MTKCFECRGTASPTLSVSKLFLLWRRDGGSVLVILSKVEVLSFWGYLVPLGQVGEKSERCSSPTSC